MRSWAEAKSSDFKCKKNQTQKWCGVPPMQLPEYRVRAWREKKQLSAYRKKKRAILNKTKMKFSAQTPKVFWTKTTECCQVVLHRVGRLRSNTLCQTETSKDGLNLKQVKGLQEPWQFLGQQGSAVTVSQEIAWIFFWQDDHGLRKPFMGSL